MSPTPVAPAGSGTIGDPSATPATIGGPSAAPATKPIPSVANLVPPQLRGILADHNRYRAKHCAPPMTWSPKIAAVAQRWANHLRDNNCAFEHSRGGSYGENLSYYSPAGSGTPSDVVSSWYGEVKFYNFSSPGFSGRTGHFTQVVWNNTTELGCGLARCANAELWVCNYGPAGNVHSQFPANVKPSSCRP